MISDRDIFLRWTANEYIKSEASPISCITYAFVFVNMFLCIAEVAY